ncbi:MAG: hypothetical protein OEY19_13015 [Gammaproteobacteria bacterium]|nr:hypothetical protein [Gammaproteobacteria bacterium]MDH5628999.1 hypothetical protein [Gammaproteobacteria bacterium]
MQSFNYYTEAWSLYIVLGLILIFLLDLKLKKTNFYLRVGVHTLIAAFAFTPQTVGDTEFYAPMLLVSLFDAEIEGVTAIYQGLITLLLVWGVSFALILTVRHLINAKFNSQNKV